MIDTCALILLGNFAFSPCNVLWLEETYHYDKSGNVKIYEPDSCEIIYKNDGGAIFIKGFSCADVYKVINHDDRGCK